MNVYPQAGFKRYITTGGADTSGLNQKSSSMGAPLAAAIIPAAASVIGSVVDYVSGNAANKRNIAMQRETNEMNYRMFQEQNQWNLEQWNRENEYNSPAQQALRLREAGINPNMVFGNGSISEASSLNSASPSPNVSPREEPVMVGQQLAQGVYTGINAYNQSQLINAQTNEINARTAGQNIQNELDRATLYQKILSLDVDSKYKQRLLDLFNDVYNYEVSLKKGAVTGQEANTNYLVQQTTYLKARQLMEQKMNESNIKLNDAQIDAISESIAQHWQEISIAWEQLAENKRNGQAQRAALGNEIIHLMNMDASTFESLGISKEMMASEKFKNYVGSVGSILVGGFSAYMTRGASMVPSPISPSGVTIPKPIWQQNTSYK